MLNIKLTKKTLSNFCRYNKLFISGIAIAWVGVLVCTNFANHQNMVRTEVADNISQYEDQLRLLNAQVSQLQSISRIEDESKRLELVKVDPQNIYYIDVKDGQVALK